MNCLITKTGKVIENGCVPHDVICKRKFGYDLTMFLSKQNGGCRVKAQPHKERIAIEYYSEPSIKQQQVIHKILAANNYYTVVLITRIIEKFRPIRSIRI